MQAVHQAGDGEDRGGDVRAVNVAVSRDAFRYRRAHRQWRSRLLKVLEALVVLDPTAHCWSVVRNQIGRVRPLALHRGRWTWSIHARANSSGSLETSPRLESSGGYRPTVWGRRCTFTWARGEPDRHQRPNPLHGRGTRADPARCAPPVREPLRRRGGDRQQGAARGGARGRAAAGVRRVGAGPTQSARACGRGHDGDNYPASLPLPFARVVVGLFYAASKATEVATRFRRNELPPPLASRRRP